MSTKDVAPQPIPPTPFPAVFERWLGSVEFLLRTRFGMTLDDTSYDRDDWMQAFRLGQPAATAAAMGVMGR